MAINFGNSANGNLLNDIMEKANQEKNTIVTIDIDIDLIDKNPDNEKIFNMNDIDFLAEGMKEEGFFGAIEVFKKANGRYEISSGHRRFEAAKKNNMDRIPCIVLEDVDDVTRAKRLLSTNIRNRKLSPLDIGRAIKYYRAKVLNNEKSGYGEGKTRDKLASFFNLSPSKVYRYESLLNLIEPLQKLCEDEEYSFACLSHASSLPKEDQEELYDMIERFNAMNPDVHITSQRIESKINELKRKKAPQQNIDTTPKIAPPTFNTPFSKNTEEPLLVSDNEDSIAILFEDEDYSSDTSDSPIDDGNDGLPQIFLEEPEMREEEKISIQQAINRPINNISTLDGDLKMYTSKLSNLLCFSNRFESKMVLVECKNELKEIIEKLDVLIKGQ